MKVTLKPSNTDTITVGTQYDTLQRHRPRRLLAGGAGDRSTDRRRRRARMGLESAVAEDVRGERACSRPSSPATPATTTSTRSIRRPSPTTPTPTNTAAAEAVSSTRTAAATRGRSSFTKYAEAFGTARAEVRARDRAQPRRHAVSALRAGRVLRPGLQRRAGVPHHLRLLDFRATTTGPRSTRRTRGRSDRMTLNIGLRLDHIRGYSPVLNEDVYTPKNAWGPRVGAAYDLTGNGRTAVRAFWGRYYEGAASAFFTAATPGIQDYLSTPINPNGSLGPPEVVTPAQVYGISSGHRAPADRRVQPVVGRAADQQPAVHRHRHLARHGQLRQQRHCRRAVQAVQITNGLTNQPLTVYNWANSAVSNDSYFIRNTEGFQYLATDGSVIGDRRSEAEIPRPHAAARQLAQEPLRLPGVVRAVQSHRHGRQQRLRQLAGRRHLELAEHRAHQRRRRADELAPARVQGVRLVSGAAHRRPARRQLLRLQRPALHAVHAADQQPAESAVDRPAAGLPRAARHANATTSSTSSICARRRRSR